MKILVTCPPMIGALHEFKARFDELGWEVTAPAVTQTLTEKELEALLPGFDGWIAGDDPVNARTLAAGKAGRLRAVVKWGVGVDNVDFAAAAKLGMPVQNTPGVFGEEVADLALGYVIALARHTFEIDRGVREGRWPKPRGISLRGRVVALVGFGNIGKATAARLRMVGMRVLVYDPFYSPVDGIDVEPRAWPDGLEDADFLVLTCPLTPETRHMVDAKTLARAKPGLRVVNVARGPLVDERALVDAMRTQRVASVALDVFEDEPLPMASPLRAMPNTIFGSHNASNTEEAARRASHTAIALLHAKLQEGA